MASLIRIVVIATVLVATPARADNVDHWRLYVAEASARFGVPVGWIERVIRAESGGYERLNGRPIRSPKGAIGLMQLMPSTWVSVRSALGLGSDPDDPRDNILAGTFYLRQMYDRFGYPGCFAAYNAGPGRYAAALAGRQSLPRETIAYLGSAGAALTEGSPYRPRIAPQSLFAVRSSGVDQAAAEGAPRPASAGPLFAIRRGAE